MEPNEVKNLIEGAGGSVDEMGILPDGSGFATASFPLSKTHWIYGDPKCERFVCEHEGKAITHEPPPMPFRMGARDHAVVAIQDGSMPPIMTRSEFADKIRIAGRYAIRASTMKGREMDFDPDAMLQNLVVGFLGYWTETGLSGDEWSNPLTEAQQEIE